MPKNLRLTLVQSNLVWEDPVANYRRLSRILSSVERGSTDLVVLPELFPTGFSMEAKRLAEVPEGPSMQWMLEMAIGLRSPVCGSLIIREGKHFFNRFIWMEPDGRYEQYDKRHLFRMAGEDKSYTPGKEGIVIEHKGWSICPIICYDLRFPVWSRNRLLREGGKQRADYDLLLAVANWPSARSFAWKQLLVARAIENQSYVAGVNRVGTDGKGIRYDGDSVALDAMGSTIGSLRKGQNGLINVTLDWKHLSEVRKKLPFLQDGDAFSVG
ncbi:MAG: amidohydrolase [Bacteroidota bacterium]|jgi:omega-amidase